MLPVVLSSIKSVHLHHIILCFILTIPVLASAIHVVPRETVSTAIVMKFSSTVQNFSDVSFAASLATELSCNASRISQIYYMDNSTSVYFSFVGTAIDPSSSDLTSALKNQFLTGNVLSYFPGVISVQINNETIFATIIPTVSGSSDVPNFLIAIIVIVAFLFVGVVAFVFYKVFRESTAKPVEYVLPPLPSFDTAATTHVAHVTPNQTAEETNLQYENWWHGKTEGKPRVYV